ncbi:MAG TPA: tetratricopeptide repeat protein [Pyrinomonadaceae bacterium]|nr:tetratricopeptide repeat protein [Pyrinomonadaceae bacterium]
MRRSTNFLSTILCLFLLAPAEVWARDNWVSVRSKNFFLVGNASEKEIRRVASQLEQFREVFSRSFDRANLSSPAPTTVVVFKDDKSYAPFKTGENTAGYFQAGPDVNYITMTTEGRGERDTFGVIFHEYTHQLISNTTRNAPTWFSEGLAEYYSTVTVSDNQKFVLGKPIDSYVYWLRQSRLLPLKTLFAVDHDSPYYNESDKQGVFYAQSWALMHYLMLGNGGKRANQIGKFLDAVTDNVETEIAFKQAFQVSFAQMESELYDYIRKGRYQMVSGHFAQKIDFDRELVTAPMTDAEAYAYRGDLLLHSNRPDAEVYLKKAIELDPNLAMAHAALGMFRVREGKIAEARASLERAVDANTQNYLIHYYYAFALSRADSSTRDFITGVSQEDANRMRVHLNKAIELRPDFLDSYGLLAYVNLVSRSNLDESERVLKRIIAASPTRGDMVFMLAQIHVAKDDYQTAGDLLQKLIKTNSDPEVKQRAQSLLEVAENLKSRRSLKESFLSNAVDTGVDGGQDEVSMDVDPSSVLRAALRKPSAGEAQVQGILTRIDCDSKGIIFIVQLPEGMFRLTTNSFRQVYLRSFSSDSGREITCGARPQENNVVVIYVPGGPPSNTKGVAKSIEFVPKDFKL